MAPTMPRRLLFWGFRPAEEVHGLGTLERQVLDVVWRLGRASVRDVLTAVDHSVAYTTAMTVMDRLFKKGVLDRERVGRAYVYSATVSSEQLQSSLVMGLLQRLLGRGPRPLRRSSRISWTRWGRATASFSTSSTAWCARSGGELDRREPR